MKNEGGPAFLNRHPRLRAMLLAVCFLGAAMQAQAQAEAAIALATQYEIAQWLTLGTILRGWAMTMQGQGATGVGQLQEGLAALRTTGPGDSRIIAA